MNYYISDLHLFHKNVTDEGFNFDGRPFKTLEAYIKRLKRIGIVWLLMLTMCSV